MSREHRDHPRRSVRIRVLTACGEDRGEGTLVDISLGGALIESSGTRPRLGAPVKISISTGAESASEDIVGTVVRHAPRGFAIQFATATKLVQRLVFGG